MKILQVHNYYNVYGGEDAVVDAENCLLTKSNHSLSTYYVNNQSLSGFRAKVSSALNLRHSLKHKNAMLALLDESKVDIAHIHNTFPLITASILDSFVAKNVATVCTLHNYRTVCPTSLLMFNGKVCEKSLEGSAYWAVTKKVYRNSFLGTALLAHMIEYHKRRKTWIDKVDRFICLTEFSKHKFIQAGFPEHKLVVKPNFTEDPGMPTAKQREKVAVFVGRLSEEKGIDTLLKAWHKIDHKLLVIGEGKPKGDIPNNVYFSGKLSKEKVISAMQSASFIVVPSICYEGFPMAIVEAFASGTPVLCSKLGSMAEIVEHNHTGMHFAPGNENDLADKANLMFFQSKLTRQMGLNARTEYEAKYTPEMNLKNLISIYQTTLTEK